MSAMTVDDYGRVLYCRGGGGTPLRKPFVKSGNEFIPLEDILVKYEGITAEEIDAMMTDEVEEAGEDDLGTLYDVSADGRTILGCGGPAKKYNWVAHLSHSVYDYAENDPVKTSPISDNNLSALYANGTIILSGVVDKIEIFDLNGQLIMQKNISSAFIPATLNNGMYIVRLYNYKTNTYTTNKIIIK